MDKPCVFRVFLSKQYLVLSQKQSSWAISLLETLFHIIKSAKTTICKMADAGNNIEADESSSYYCKKILKSLAWVI